MGRAFRFVRQLVFCLGGLPCLLYALAVLAAPTFSQDVTPPVTGFPEDWSHYHLVFSKPATAEQFMQVQQDPRYWQQLARRTVALRPEAEVGDAVSDDLDVHVPLPRLKRKMKRDWQQVMNAGATVGAGQYPAKYSFGLSTAKCSDFVVFNTGLTGSATQANIIAYTNLYATGCTGTVPQVYWAYNTGGKVSTSVTISADGSQVAFVQTPATGSVQLVVLKWKSSTTETASLPMTLSNTAATSYRACTAPCMTELTYVAGPSETAPLADTNSSPYYDFGGGADKDTLYVGDDPGYLHQFTGVFLGTPTETSNATAGAGWPSRAAQAPLSSPVFDAVSGNVFVTASWQQSDDSGGRLHAICVTTPCGATSTTAGTPVVSSYVLGPANGNTNCHTITSGNGAGSAMRVDAPLVDSTAKMVYVFMGNDGTGSSAVYQFPTAQASISGSCGTETTIGTVAPASPDYAVFAGTFDNVYYTSASGSSPSGNLYVCGNTTGVPTLYQIAITSNAMGATKTLEVSTANTTCSSVTEIYNAPTDYAFLSVVASSTPICGVGTGCLMSFTLPTTVGGALPTAPTATLAAVGGTSGLVLDNTVASGTLKGASQVYFSPLSNQTCNGTAGEGCAVQASQALLK
jgi:hypothetical protein